MQYSDHIFLGCFLKDCCFKQVQVKMIPKKVDWSARYENPAEAHRTPLEDAAHPGA